MYQGERVNIKSVDDEAWVSTRTMTRDFFLCPDITFEPIRRYRKKSDDWVIVPVMGVITLF
jgi:uncharacterized protein YjhX (UPF0386 family)